MRHLLVRDFATRLYNAFGYEGPSAPFDTGWLHDMEGRFLHLVIGGVGLWDERGERRGIRFLV